MTTSSTPSPGQGSESGQPKKDDAETFETDISETDEEGTNVRQAEVREDDLSEVDKPKKGQA